MGHPATVGMGVTADLVSHISKARCGAPGTRRASNGWAAGPGATLTGLGGIQPEEREAGRFPNLSVHEEIF